MRRGSIVRDSIRRDGDALSPSDLIATASIATWDPTLVRYFFVDNDNGNDGNVGYIDAAAGTIFTPAQSASFAIKTSTRLRQIFPRMGNGRMAVVLFKNRAAGATYKAPDGATDDNYDFSGTNGYCFLLKRGSTDLSNGDGTSGSINDRVLCGFITAAVATGPNGDGSYTASGVPTVNVINIAAGAFPAEPGMIGMRVRFKGNVTAALANQVRNIWANAAGQVTLGRDSSVACVAGDDFWIEEVGVRFGRVREVDGTANLQTNGLGAGLATPFGTAIAGIACTSTATGAFFVDTTSGQQIRCAGLAAITATNNSVLTMRGRGGFVLGQPYSNELGTVIDIGIGWRGVTGATFGPMSPSQIGTSAFVNATAAISYGGPLQQFGENGMYLQNGATVESTSSPGSANGYFTGVPIVGAVVASAQALRVVGGTLRLQGTMATEKVNMQGAAGIVLGSTSSATRVPGRGGFYSLSTVTGTCTNAFGIDCSGLRGAIVIINRGASASTVTGATGDILLGGSAPTTHASFDITAVTDELGNFYSSLTATVSQGAGMQCLLYTNRTGGTVNVGNIMRGNATSAEAVQARANTAANATGVLGVAVTPALNNGLGLLQVSGLANIRMDAAATVTNLCYLSEANAGQGRDTPPALAATNQTLRFGYIERAFAVNAVQYAAVPWHPDHIPALSTGVPP